jgi:hypothetical protein
MPIGGNEYSSINDTMGINQAKFNEFGPKGQQVIYILTQELRSWETGNSG